MHKLSIVVASAALIGLAAAAHANEVRGVVKSVDETDHRVTLMSGDTIALPSHTSTGELNAGDVIEVTWYRHDDEGFKQAFDIDVMMRAKDREATRSADVPQGQTIRGVVAEIDPTNNTITLANDDVFALGASPHASDLVPGDIVQLKWWRHDEDGIKRVYNLERIHEIAISEDKDVPAPPQGARIEGTIAALDHTDNRITLENGVTFALGTGEHANDFTKGQQVALTWYHWEKGYRLANNVEVINN